MPVGGEITIKGSSCSVLLHSANKGGLSTNHAFTALSRFSTLDHKGFPVMPYGLYPLPQTSFSSLALYHCKGRSILCLLQTSLLSTANTDLKNPHLKGSTLTRLVPLVKFPVAARKLLFVFSRPCVCHGEGINHARRLGRRARFPVQWSVSGSDV